LTKGSAADPEPARRKSSNAKLSLAEQKQRHEEHTERAESLALVRKVRRAWSGEVRKAGSAEDGDPPLPPFQAKYSELSAKALELSVRPWFVNVLTATILAAGATVGLQTELSQPGAVEPQPALDALDSAILAIFTVEVPATYARSSPFTVI
jgi:hypothetical protein